MILKNNSSTYFFTEIIKIHEEIRENNDNTKHNGNTNEKKKETKVKYIYIYI